MRYLHLLPLLVLACGGSERSPDPPLKPMYFAGPPPAGMHMGREIAQLAHHSGSDWYFRPEREAEERPDELFEALALRADQTLCDIGAGNGYHALRYAPRVERVFAVEIQPELLVELRRRAREAGIENIETVHGTIIDPMLEAASCDLILLVDTYHEFSEPTAMLDVMRKALRPGGRLAIVEFRAEDPDSNIHKHHKMERAQLLRELSEGGYALDTWYEGLPAQHLAIFSPASP